MGIRSNPAATAIYEGGQALHSFLASICPAPTDEIPIPTPTPPRTPPTQWNSLNIQINTINKQVSSLESRIAALENAPPPPPPPNLTDILSRLDALEAASLTVQFLGENSEIVSTQTVHPAKGGTIIIPQQALRIRWTDAEGTQIGESRIDEAPLGSPLRVKFVRGKDITTKPKQEDTPHGTPQSDQ